MDPIAEAREYLDAADEMRKLPYSPWADVREYDRRHDVILQLHIRALVAVAPIFDRRDAVN
ncbi:MAG: hypothetical protein ACYDA6_09680 [Solirubrobacteraceae bacterium]